MKFKFLAILGIALVLNLSYGKEASAKQVTTQMQKSTTASTPVAQMVKTADDSGTFKAGEHPTQGTNRVVTEEKAKRNLKS
ncbi:MAG: hypothetical protein KME54_23090 [Tolypothrix brevis GSE-NOS-MK-07-07A]|jgi:hypothetical protein|nr:hypothetical protein [Tolypothrix brevis GSE-NOS-MK-07-07A]